MASITVFADVILSNQVLAAGVQGRNSGQNKRVTQLSGAQQINVTRDRTQREYDWGTVPLRRSDWQYMETLHEVTSSGAYGFLMEDPKDSTVGTGGGVVTGLTSTTFQMWKRYTHTGTARTKDRKITRPRASGLVVMISGTPTGAYTLDSETGILTIAAAPAAANVTWTGRFYVPVHFQSDTIDWQMVVAGQDPDSRFIAGTSVVLEEILE